MSHVPPDDQPTVSLTPEAREAMLAKEPEDAAPAPRSRFLMFFIGLLAVLVLGAALGLFFLGNGPRLPGSLQDGGTSPEREVPPALRPYYDRAGTGDASAMRMLGTMYYNGLNVRKDTKEGIRWYRKAAAAGSVAARKDLEQLGLASNEP
jgi:TPR repeat protein